MSVKASESISRLYSMPGRHSARSMYWRFDFAVAMLSPHIFCFTGSKRSGATYQSVSCLA